MTLKGFRHRTLLVIFSASAGDGILRPRQWACRRCWRWERRLPDASWRLLLWSVGDSPNIRIRPAILPTSESVRRSRQPRIKYFAQTLSEYANSSCLRVLHWLLGKERSESPAWNYPLTASVVQHSGGQVQTKSEHPLVVAYVQSFR